MRLPLGVLYFGGFMKRVVYFILAAAVLAGIIVAGCHKSDKQDDSDFETFEAQILDYNVWTTIHSPGVLGLDDIGVTLAIGSGDYANQQVYSGKVTWRVDPQRAIKFLPIEGYSTVSEDGFSATGTRVMLKPFEEGDTCIYAEDSSGHQLSHEFRVGAGQHYTAEGGWQDASSGYLDDWGGSSSSEEEEWGNSSSVELYD